MAQLVEHVTLDLGVVNSSPTWAELTLKKQTNKQKPLPLKMLFPT